MRSVRDHYDEHLAPIYSWMAGGVEAAISRGRAELDAITLLPNGGTAVDLGAGFGMHSIPLASRGFKVLAIDSSADLLDELEAHAGVEEIQRVVADLLTFRDHLTCEPNVVLCMGDTLTHLPSREAVESLFGQVAAALTAGGVFVLTFRDYCVALAAEQRFIPVRSDANRILTCFLEYDDDCVIVHDLLNEQCGVQWKLHVSSYRKLRLAPDWLCSTLERYGFTVVREAGLGGMTRLVAQLHAKVSATGGTDVPSLAECHGAHRL